ncbi:hypothetical protein BUALT_Bualt11G0024700 [Buddleja alternifolia]|uniref:Uncharacterized protein n=1 Tax=Buddleja alternifolia TaxID=168488 RepID=A0AAV6X0H6_9LAMI|nr:hypothetical protein BUALT_Bualt11G0024700 [Buddleja alternifolia]
MALSFTRFPWLWLGGKEKEQISNGSLINSINSLSDFGLGLRGESEGLKFYPVKGGITRMPSSSSNRKTKRKWKSREERIKRVDKEYDVVLVPSDCSCLSGSESDDSDWSIGWLEPHAPDFQSDDEGDDSFAVLVPCYRHNCKELEEKEMEPSFQFMSDVKNLPNDYSAVPARRVGLAVKLPSAFALEGQSPSGPRKPLHASVTFWEAYAP